MKGTSISPSLSAVAFGFGKSLVLTALVVTVMGGLVRDNVGGEGG